MTTLTQPRDAHGAWTEPPAGSMRECVNVKHLRIMHTPDGQGEED